MKIEFDLGGSPGGNQLRFKGIAAPAGFGKTSSLPEPVCIEATLEKSPALAVWEAWEKLKPLCGEKLIVQGPEGFCSSFHYQIAAYIARSLIVLQDHSATKDKAGSSDKPLDKHLPAIRSASFPDPDLFGHGLAQLARYAQAEWIGAYIPCPLERRLRSVFIALHRVCNDETSLYLKVSPAKADGDYTDQKTPLGMVSVLFQCALRSASSTAVEDETAVTALEANRGYSKPEYPGSPLLEGIFDNCKFTGHYWLKSLVERLKTDRDAYKRDAARANKEYSALVHLDGKIVPVETIRIESPESLLFDLWAWQDCENSKEHRGFPLVWIDNGWHSQGFELRLDPSMKKRPKPLDQQAAALGFPEPKQINDAGRSLTYPDVASVKSDVRYRLKRKLFPDGAAFTGEFIPILPTYRKSQRPSIQSQWAGPAPLLDRAIRDSELGSKQIIPDVFRPRHPGSKTYLWAEVEFADIDIYASWAGDEIASILYSLLRPAAQMTLPNDFLDHHVHRSPGMVYAWAREGMVVAYHRDQVPQQALSDLKEAIVEAAGLDGELADLIEGMKNTAPSAFDVERRRVRVRNVIRQHLDLRQRSARPDLRALRGFLERRHAQEVYDAFRQSESDNNQVEMLNEINQSSDRLDWLEAVLFAFAITEAGHILAEALLPNSWVLATSVASGIGFFGACIFLLLPKWKAFQNPLVDWVGKGIVLLVSIAILVGAIIFGSKHPGGVKEPLPAIPSNPPCASLCNPSEPVRPIPSPPPNTAIPAAKQAVTPTQLQPAKS